jgi:hypothetical protein
MLTPSSFFQQAVLKPILLPPTSKALKPLLLEVSKLVVVAPVLPLVKVPRLRAAALKTFKTCSTKSATESKNRS